METVSRTLKTGSRTLKTGSSAGCNTVPALRSVLAVVASIAAILALAWAVLPWGGPLPMAAAAPRACIAPPANLAAWWALDEPNGTVASDRTGGNHGTVDGGGGAQSAGKVGIARTFDGTDDVVLVPDNVVLDPGSGGFSVDAWVRLGDRGGAFPIVNKVYAPADAPIGWQFGVEGSSPTFQMDFPSGTAGVSLATQVPHNSWHFMAVTVQRGSASGGRIYLDGQLAGTFSTTGLGVVGLAAPLDTDAELRIGSKPVMGRNQPSTFFFGQIDEVEVFRRTLTAAEVLALFNAGSDGKCKTVEPTPGPNLTGTIRTGRGCQEAGEAPVYFTGDTLQASLRVDGAASAYIRVMGLGSPSGPRQLDGGDVMGGVTYNMDPITIAASVPGVRALALEARYGETFRELARCSFLHGGDQPPTATPCPGGVCATPTATTAPTPTAPPTRTTVPTPSPTATPSPTVEPSPTPSASPTTFLPPTATVDVVRTLTPIATATRTGTPAWLCPVERAFATPAPPQMVAGSRPSFPHATGSRLAFPPAMYGPFGDLLAIGQRLLQVAEAPEVALLRQIRDGVFIQDPVGLVLVAIFDRHADEVSELMKYNDAQLREPIRALIVELAPTFRPLVDDNAPEPTVTADQIRRIDAILAILEARGSPALAAEVRSWRARIAGWGGLTARQIWQRLHRQGTMLLPYAGKSGP